MKLRLSRWLLFLPFLTTLGAVDYSIVDIASGKATGINNSGVLVGHDSNRGFLYDSTGLHYTRPKAWLLGETNAVPWEPGVTFAYGVGHLEWYGINEAGRLVGSGVLTNKWSPVPPNEDTRPYPIVWDGSGDAIALDLPGQGARAVNFNGVVVGGSEGAYSFDGTNVTLLSPLGLTAASDINRQGVIAGLSQGKPAILDQGVLTLLDIPGTGDVGNFITTTAINLSGQVTGTVGRCGPFNCTSRGYVWAAGNLVYLDSPGGGELDALDINDSGVVVGRMEVADGDYHAFIFRAGELVDLNTLIPNSGWVLTEARAINESGQIVGAGRLNGLDKAFLLNPLHPGNPIPPSIEVSPQGGRFALGDSVTLTVSLSGTAPFQYQWQRNRIDLEGQTIPTLVLSDLDATDIGSYRVIVRNAAGEAFSADAEISIEDPAIDIAKYAGIAIRGTVGGRYRVETAPRLDGAEWSSLGFQGLVTLTNSPQLWFDLTSGTNPAPRYYRVIRERP